MKMKPLGRIDHHNYIELRLERDKVYEQYLVKETFLDSKRKEGKPHGANPGKRRKRR